MMTESSVTIRAAAEHDTSTVLRMIRALAAYEDRVESCTVTEPTLRDALFGARPRI